MKNYEEIDGWASMEEQGELFKTICKNGMRVAEVGVYKGRMSMMIMEMFGGRLEYHCVDHFQGSAEHERLDYLDEFLENTAKSGVRVEIGESTTVAGRFDDGFFDIVYLDASHDYLSVKADIQAWLPKVKKGGVLCGDDYIRGWDGVIQAVDEAFGDNVRIAGKQQWWIVKEG